MLLLSFIRVAANGRNEVQCLHCLNYFWPDDDEIRRWTVCAHCVGWWTWPVPATKV